MILRFDMFIYNEVLHINKDVDELSDYIYSIISNSNERKFKITDNLPLKLNLKEINISILNNPKANGSLNLNRSFIDDDGKWIIYLEFKKDAYIDIVKHEVNHILQLVKKGKYDMVSKLNNIKAGNIFIPNQIDEIDSFFHLIYLSNDDEISSMITETYALLKEVSKTGPVTNDAFNFIIKSCRAYKISNDLTNYNFKESFSNFSDNEINKFLYIYEESKHELSKIEKGKFKFIKDFKLLFNSFKNYRKVNLNDDKIYKPIKDYRYYENWFHSQGEKLKNKLFKLKAHFE